MMVGLVKVVVIGMVVIGMVVVEMVVVVKNCIDRIRNVHLFCLF